MFSDCPFEFGAFEYAKKEISRDGMMLECIDETLKDYKSLVMKAVENNGLALQFASNRMKISKGVVLMAVAQNGRALEFADDMLKNDKDVVRIAYKQDIQALEFASDRLKEYFTNKKDDITKEQALEMVKENGLALDDLNKESSEEVLLTLLENWCNEQNKEK